MLLIMPMKNIHMFNFCCLTVQQNFITTETFAEYSMYTYVL